MIFEDFNPLEDKIFRVIDNDGRVLNPAILPRIDENTIRDVYKKMLYFRVADQMAVSYQRQGRMFTYPLCIGHEAIHMGAAMAMRDDDWLVPAFRELGVMLSRGVTMQEIFLFYMGHEQGLNFANAPHVLPICVPIGSQYLHATGIAYSIKYQKKDEVVFPFIGDGGTSEGDFSEALNFAAVWQVPVVFTIQNNQYAISVPVQSQTRSINLAVKGVGFGIPSVKVDGNDFFAMYAAYEEAQEWARSGKGPVLIEAYTYRKGAHTTSDDPSKYRTKEEEKRWEDADPMKRLKLYMQHQKIWDIDEDALIAEYKESIDAEFSKAEELSVYPLEEAFDHMYVDMPDDLRRQKAEYEQFIKWKEARR